MPLLKLRPELLSNGLRGIITERETQRQPPGNMEESDEERLRREVEQATVELKSAEGESVREQAAEHLRSALERFNRTIAPRKRAG